MKILVIVTTVLGLVSSEMKVVDLSHPLNEDSIKWPSYHPFSMNILYRERQPAGYWLEANTIKLVEHTSTHIDAPSHLYEGGRRMDKVPIDRLVGPGVVVNVEAAAKANPDYQVTVEDLQKWESEYGKIPDKAIILMHSGWSKKYPDKTLVFGSKDHTNSSTFHFPAFSVQAVKWLITNRKINVLGVDTPSFDYGQSLPTFPVHRLLLKNDIPGLENVANLDAIPPEGTTITVGALKITDASGAPTRLIALYDNNANAGSRTSFSLAILMSALILQLG